MTKVIEHRVTLLGIPFDENSSFLRGAALAPPVIRNAYFSESSNLFTENKIDLGSQTQLSDSGDIDFSTEIDAFVKIEEKINSFLNQQCRILCLGGDHSITYPILRAYAKKYPQLNIIHLDAHPDLYDEFDGNRFSHACPFARIKEENLCNRLIQIGIRAMNPHLQSQVERFGVEVFEMKNWTGNIQIQIDGPVYVSLDMDVLDPAFAPGVSHPEAGGLFTREVIKIIQQIKNPVVGADIVEFNPKKDFASITAVATAKLMKEILAKMLE